MPTLWPPNATAHLVAWLDFCKTNTTNFKATIISHLKSTVEHTYTDKQVCDKLIDLWRGPKKERIWGPRDGLSCYDHLLVTGSSDLSERVPRSILQDVERILKEHAANWRQTHAANFSEAPTKEAERLPAKMSRNFQRPLSLIDSIRKDWETEVRELQQKIEELQNKLQDSEARNHTLQSTIKEKRDSGPDEYPLNQLCRLRDETIKQKKKILEAYEYSRFANVEERVQTTDMVCLINTSTKDLTTNLESIVFSPHNSFRLLTPELHAHPELESLLRVVFDTRHNLGRRLRNLVRKYTVELVVRVLLLAALQDWVFMTDYPNFSSVDNSSMYDSLRHEIFNQGKTPAPTTFDRDHC